jgi:hypothetical protein
VEKVELNAVKFDIPLFWKLENFVNLDGADAVEPDNCLNCFKGEITSLPDVNYGTPISWITGK